MAYNDPRAKIEELTATIGKFDPYELAAICRSFHEAYEMSGVAAGWWILHLADGRDWAAHAAPPVVAAHVVAGMEQLDIEKIPREARGHLLVKLWKAMDDEDREEFIAHFNSKFA